MTVSAPRHPWGGVYSATICPMKEDGAIDHGGVERHLAEVGSTAGLAGFLINGHAGENAALEREELIEVLRVARSVAGPLRVVAGVNAESAGRACVLAADAAQAGADAVMVFPPFSWTLGADDGLVRAHHEAVASASSLPLFLFQGAVGAGRTRFGMDTLRGLLEIESVVGIKEGSWEALAYEETRRLSRSLRPDVGVMASGDEHLFVCFLLGSEGSLVSLAAVVPELIVALERAVVEEDVCTARSIHDRLYRLARLVYAAPGHLAALRLKTCLKHLGRLNETASRCAGARIDPSESDALRVALVQAGVLDATK